MFLSIITPTYNRARLLPRLYESLTSQSDRDLEWIIIDDGSTDETENIVKRFIAENKIPIRYKLISHSGKPTAHNEGVMLALGELTVCVDSDDALTPDAVELIKDAWDAESNGDIGIIAARVGFDGKSRLCSAFPEKSSISFTELTDCFGFEGDTALFLKTSVLRENPFPRFDGENFIPEDALYFRLDSLGKLRILNEGLYLCEYLEDGLTANYLSLLRRNPMGTAYSYYVKAMTLRSFKSRLKRAIVSESYLKLSGRCAEYDKSRGKMITFIARLLCPVYMRKKGLK